MQSRIPLTVRGPSLPRIPVTFIGFWQGRRIDDIVPTDADELIGKLRQWRDYFTTFTQNVTAQNFSQATASFAPRVFAFLDTVNLALRDIDRGGFAAVDEQRIRALVAQGGDLYFESRTFYRAISEGTRTRPDFITPPPDDDPTDPDLTESPEISSGEGSESSDMDMDEE